MKRGFEYAPTKCNDHKITARCRVSDCPWRIKARQVPGIAQWWVQKFDSQHTCSRAIGGLGHRNCDAAFIASFVREQVVANEKYTPKMVQTEILRQHGVKISYWKAYRARELVIQEVRGDFEGSFALLPSYMQELKSGDAETCLQLLYQDEGHFHRFFWAFGAAIRAFRKHCRPLIGLDGLIDAVSDVFPDAAHGYCIYHLSTNLPHAPKNTPAWRRFWAAARAYTVAEFNEHMEKMKELNPEQYKYVVKLPRHRWATHCFLGRRYSMLTSNCAETINSVIRHLKGLPITYLVEETRKKTACYFYQRKNNGKNITSVVTPYAEKILGSSRETSRFYTLNPSNDVLFQVITADRTDVVDLSKKTCSYKRWDIDGIPCNHAMATISFRLKDPYDFVEDWFMTSTYRATYNDCVPPTRGKEQWPAIPSNVVPPRPPNVRIQPGRRKVSRRESIANGLIKKRCRNCQRWGHNKSYIGQNIN
ncbi:hypothetical protein ACMD2_26327 [Ananas comosus]|uniref:Zinc finger PMZ-type domain-containing protein n=1 Tax=Ananas comosus TaxID=4615 RepID=A0A199V8P7_ANACO|nr:hypothetical protein ACMD2_26327 [Ananas comosus]